MVLSDNRFDRLARELVELLVIEGYGRGCVLRQFLVGVTLFCSEVAVFTCTGIDTHVTPRSVWEVRVLVELHGPRGGFDGRVEVSGCSFIPGGLNVEWICRR